MPKILQWGWMQEKTTKNCYFGQSCLTQAVPVRSCIIVGVQKPAEVAANVARHDPGALFCVTVKWVYQQYCALGCYSKSNLLLELAIS